MINALYMNDLNEMPTEEERQRFRIEDLSSLNWAMRKLTAIEAKKAEVNTLANDEIERIEHYRKSELEKLADSEDFFKTLIQDYASRKRSEDPKYKSEKTPYGSISFRKQQPKWIYDDQALVDFLEENDHHELIRVKKEPVKTEIKKLFKVDNGLVVDEHGQIVEGIRVEEQPDTLDIKVGG